MSFVHDNGCRPHKRPHKGYKGSVLYMVMAVGGLLRPSAGQDPFGPLSGLPRGPLNALLVVLCTLLAAHPRALQAPAWAARGAPGGNSRISVRWSAVPIAHCSIFVAFFQSKWGSGPRGADDLWFHTG